MATIPALRVYIDWDNLASSSHDFTTDPRADMTGKVSEPFNITRGRSLDFSSDARGQLTFRIPVGRIDGSFARRFLVTPGLVGYWLLGEASGTTAADSAGVDKGAYVATPTLGAGGPLVGDTSTAVTLNGTTQYVTVPDSKALDLANGPLTIAAWVKRSATGVEHAIVGKGTGAYYLYIGSDNKVYLAKQGTGAVAGTTVTIADTSWHFVVATYAGTTTGKVYIDAVDRTTTTATQTLADTTTALGIGSQSGASAAAPFAGTLAQVALWNRALTSTEVTAIYAAGTRNPVFPAYDKIGRGDVMLGRRVLVLADWLDGSPGEIMNRPLFSGRITRIEMDPVTYDLSVTCGDDFETFSTDIPDWPVFEGTFREVRADIVRRMQTMVPTYSENKAWRNPNGGASRCYWTSVPVNRVANPGFETDTTGWSVADDRKTTQAAVSITRTATGHTGSWRAVIVSYNGAAISGAWYDLSGQTFTAGHTYRYAAWVKGPAGTQLNIDLYSNGTADGDGGGVVPDDPNVWYRIAGTWTPTANRTDVHLLVSTQQAYQVTFSADSVAVWEVDSKEGAWYDLTYQSPLCLSSTAAASTVSRQLGTGPLGLGTFIRGTATSGASVALPFYEPGAWTGDVPTPLETFSAWTHYAATAWIRGVGTGRILLGSQSNPLSAGKSAPITLNATTWQRVYLDWFSTYADPPTWFVAESTGTTIDVAGLVIVTGTATWDWVLSGSMDGLDTAEDGMHVCRITPSGTPLAALGELNRALLTRHWCQPTSTYPWWRYRTRSIVAPTRTVAETYTDDVADYTGSKQSYDSLINVVRFSTSGGYFDGTTGAYVDPQATYEGEVVDAASVALWGRIATDINSNYLEPFSSALTTVPAAILANYSVQRQRLSFAVENRWPSQLWRELDDLIVLTLPRLGIINGRFIIVGITHDISVSGRLWRTTYQVEAAPPP